MLTLANPDSSEKNSRGSADRASGENTVDPYGRRAPTGRGSGAPAVPRPVPLVLSPVLVPLTEQSTKGMFPGPFRGTLCSLLRGALLRDLLGAFGGRVRLESEALLGIGRLAARNPKDAAPVAVLKALLAHDAHAEQARERRDGHAAQRGSLHGDVEERAVSLDEAKAAAHLLDLH